MKKRGRKSEAESALTVVVDIDHAPPPPPPADLSPDQADIWRDIAGAMPSRWLRRGAYAILAEYCRHVVRARLLDQQIAAFRPEWLKADGGLERLDRLLAMGDRETRAALACARALRLTPQAQINPRSAGRQMDDMPATAQGKRPWDPQ